MLHASHHSRRSRRSPVGKLASVCAFGKLLGIALLVDTPQAAADDGQQGMWTERDTLTASDGSQTDKFGKAVALFKDYALVGAYQAVPGGLSNAGAAYIFVKSGTEWHQQATLTASDAAENADFGWSVALVDDYALVGADGAAPGGVSGAGAAYIFVKSGTEWHQQATLTASDQAPGATFGSAAALVDDYALVGAYSAATGGINNAGAAYIFVKSGTEWHQQATLTASDPVEDDYFGSAAALYGYNALVGPDNSGVPGKAYSFSLTGHPSPAPSPSDDTWVWIVVGCVVGGVVLIAAAVAIYVLLCNKQAGGQPVQQPASADQHSKPAEVADEQL